MTRRLITLSAALFGFAAFAHAGTNVGGEITTTTWTAANAPYHVVDTVTVPVGNTLTIEPGVDVLFDAEVPFLVSGSVHAVGTEADSIRFVKGTASRWRGLRLYSVDGDTCTLHYVRFSGGYTEAPDFTCPDNYGGGLCVGVYDETVPASPLRAGLQHVVASGNVAVNQGGGIAIHNSIVTMANCTMRDNLAYGRGGGIYISRSQAQMVDCVVEGNTVLPGKDRGFAGGVRIIFDSQVRIERCSIVKNSTSHRGGGIVLGHGSDATLVDCTISGNLASEDGAGVLVDHRSTLSVIGGKILENVARRYGGGLNVHTSHVVVDSCMIAGNVARLGGGVSIDYELSDGSSTLAIERSSINGNTANEGGGVFISAGHEVHLTRCVIAGNEAKVAGGAAVVNGELSIINCTITDNTAPSSGGIRSSAGSTTLASSIVWGNASIGATGTLAATYSDVEGGWPGESNINADPLFADAPNGDYRLLWGSPCINTGDPNSPLDPGGTRADMGAFYHPHGVSVRENERPVSFHLAQKIPNPFNPSTTIRFTLPEAGQVRVAVYDVRGALTRTLVDQAFLSGSHSVVWDGKDWLGRNVASGVYVYRLTTTQGVVTKRMTLLR
jgi:hypothetical protein